MTFAVKSLLWGVNLIFIPVLPTLVQDIIVRADKWGADDKNGRIDPFTDIYDVSLFLETPFLWLQRRAFPSQLVILASAHLTTCHDLAKNEGDLKSIGETLTILNKSHNPLSLFLPWFLSPMKTSGWNSTVKFYTMIRDYVEARRKADLTSDAIDVLIADGETTHNIVRVSFDPKFVMPCLTRPFQFVMGVFFVGIVNTGLNSESLLRAAWR